MHRLVEALEVARQTRSRKAKVAALAAAFRKIRDGDGAEAPGLQLAARMLSGQLLPPHLGETLGVGFALLAEAVVRVAKVRDDELWAHARKAGDLSVGVAEVFASRTEAPGLSLNEAATLVARLSQTSSRDEKLTLLLEGLGKARPLEAKYLTGAILGELRVGVQRGTLDEALAAAFEVPLAALRKAASVVADPGQLAKLAARGALHEAKFEPGAPLAFMLATPNEQVKEPLEVARFIAEDKLDGVRCQVQVHEGRVWLFARGTGEVTQAYPEVAASLKGLQGTLVLDGEIVAVTADQRARPFHVLQARIGRVNPSAELQAQVPVALVLWDVMVDGAEVLLEKPWHERRKRLEGIVERLAHPRVVLNAVHRLDPALELESQLESLFTAARGRANEGLVLKDTESLYEAGRRGSAWRKVKKALATLDAVVTYAEWGHGKRANVMSDYTFALWKGEALVEIGKAYSGLTDKEITMLTEKFQALTLETRGRVHKVKPEVVLEVTFDGLQRSGRHASGLSLRFPRIVRIRDDKTAAEADTLEAAEALFSAQLESGHREDEPAEGNARGRDPFRGEGP